jgi:hypothetical protein
LAVNERRSGDFAVPDLLDKRTDFSQNLAPLKQIWLSEKAFPSVTQDAYEDT